MDQPTRSITKIALLNSASPFWRALVLLLFGCACFAFWGAVKPNSLNRIQKENRQPGTTAWQLTNPADNRQIEGYASLTSVPVGGDIDLFVNTQDATYTLSVFRMGWYGGKGGRKVLGPQKLTGVQQAMPTADPTKDLIECHWSNPFPIHVPSSWLSGIYLVKLHGNTSSKESYIIFTVRDSRHADIIFQQSVATYEAYNPWPGIDSTTGLRAGQSLYPFGTKDDAQVKAVSFNRPYKQDTYIGLPYPPFYGVGAGDFLYNVAPVAMDYSMVRWLEREGYDVTYITDIDTHEDVGRLLRGKGFLSVGHDEYWSEEMKSNVVQARDQGVGLGFFGGNYMYWQVEFLSDSTGAPNRTISLGPKTTHCQGATAVTQELCNSDADCAAGETCKVKNCFYSCNEDANGVSETEQAIVGGMDDPGVVLPNIVWGGDILVTNDVPLDHWVFANTGLHVGDVIPGLIGIEYNSTLRPEDWNIPDPPRSNPGYYPIPTGLTRLLHTQAPNFGARPGFSLPPDFDGKDWNHWYESSVAGRQPDSDVCNSGTRDGMACTLDNDDPTSGCPKTDPLDPNEPTPHCIPFCDKTPFPPLNLPLPADFCSNPYPYYADKREDWAMTIYQASSGAWVFNAATNDWAWGLDDYFTGLQSPAGANNGPALRTQCGYPFFHPDLVSCRSPAIEQITRNVLNKFIGRP